MDRTANLFRSSVGEFRFDLVMGAHESPCRMGVNVQDESKWETRYVSWKAAKDALQERRTGYLPWDELSPVAAKAELDDAERWHGANLLRGI